MIRLALANPLTGVNISPGNIICDAKISYRNATVSLRLELLAISWRSDYSAVEFDMDGKKGGGAKGEDKGKGKKRNMTRPRDVLRLAGGV